MKSNNPYKLFYVLSVLLLVYMLFSAYTSYVTFINYCEAYSLSTAEQWFEGFKSILAACIPCLVYASLCYGLGWMLQNKQA